jgi:hypothetical protein
MNIYCDEAGYTGRNLLSIDQPYFVYVAMRLTDNEIASIKDIVEQNYSLQGGEIKGSKIAKTVKGQKLLLKIFENYSKNARIVFHDKKYALAGKIVETCIEPYLISNFHFYQSKLHIFIASKLYSAFLERNNSAESLFNDFEQIIKGNLTIDKSILGTLKAEHEIVDWILEIVNSEKEILKDELGSDNEKVDKWMTDLTTTSLLALLSEWYKFKVDLKVFCDESLIFLNNPVFDSIKKMGLSGKRVKIFDGEVGFKLKGEIEHVDSKENLGIQIADLFASTVYYCLNVEPKTDFSKAILRLVGGNSICTPDTSCLIPEDLSEPEFQLNKEYYYQFMELIRGKLKGKQP